MAGKKRSLAFLDHPLGPSFNLKLPTFSAQPRADGAASCGNGSAFNPAQSTPKLRSAYCYNLSPFLSLCCHMLVLVTMFSLRLVFSEKALVHTQLLFMSETQRVASKKIVLGVQTFSHYLFQQLLLQHL